MSQIEALAALEPYLNAARAADSTDKAIVVITKATSDPKTFVYAELLAIDNIKNVATSDQSTYHTLLRLFSYGTYTDYKKTPGLPELNDSQRSKLRQLSIVTLAQDPSNLTYERLLPALDLQTAKELESIVASAIWSGLIQATIDARRQVIEVHSVAPLRDLAPGTLESIKQVLRQWIGRCEDTLGELKSQITQIQQEELSRTQHDIDVKKLYSPSTGRLLTSSVEDIASGPSWEALMNQSRQKQLIRSEIPRSGRSKRTQGSTDDIDMDVDDNDEYKKRTSRRKL